MIHSYSDVIKFVCLITSFGLFELVARYLIVLLEMGIRHTLQVVRDQVNPICGHHFSHKLRLHSPLAPFHRELEKLIAIFDFLL